MRRPVTIIILTWNGLRYTRECLTSLKDNTSLDKDCQVIVVDNGSTDGTVEFLGKLDWITLIKNGRNLGFVRGNNIGIRAAPAASDIVLLNNDMVISQSNWLEHTQAVAYSSPDVGLVGCRLLTAEGRLHHVGTFMPTDTFWGQQIGGDEKDVNQFNADREVDGVIAACVYIKREVIGRIGFLNEAYFSYFEDTDYCLCARKAGYRTICAGSVTLIHHENVSTRINRVNFSAQFFESQRTFKRRWAKYLRPRYERSLVWHSGPGYFSYVSKELAVQLDGLGVEVRLVGADATDWTGNTLGHYLLEKMTHRRPKKTLPHVALGPQDTLTLASGQRCIGYIVPESGHDLTTLIEQAQCMDELWVTSSSAKQRLEKAGLSIPICVMPWGADPDYFNPRIKAFRPSTRLTFLACMTWAERVTLENLLRAFTAEFSSGEAVLLMVKLIGGGEQARQWWTKLNLPQGRAPIALLPNPALPAYQRGSLYRSVDCLVAPSKVGWGDIQSLEAMACGRPVISPYQGIGADLFDSENSYPLPAKPTTSRFVEALRQAMRQVYDEPEQAREKGLRASQKVSSDYTWQKAAARIAQRLEEISS
ncbi:MAG: glycosyltransferase [Anaerolineae bacterium]|nr:MAG: glycosyltransferase [Anaerolineae bacterium]